MRKIVILVVVIFLGSIITLNFIDKDKKDKKLLDNYIKEIELIDHIITSNNVDSWLEENNNNNNLYVSIKDKKEDINKKIKKLETIKDYQEKYNVKNIEKKLTNNYKDKLTILYHKSGFYKDSDNLKESYDKSLKAYKKINEYLTFMINNQDKWYEKNGNIYYNDSSFNEQVNIEIKDTHLTNVLVSETRNIPVLMYHGILDKPWGISNLFVRINEFEEQMKYLADNGYTTLFMSEIDKNVDKPIIITFDDGYLDVYRYAYPILKRYNLKATAFVIGGFADGNYYMTYDNMKELSDSNTFEIGSHTMTHKPLAKLTNEEIENELKNSKVKIEEVIKKEVNVIAYPTGSFDDRVIDIAKKYYKYGLSTISGIETFDKNTNNYKIKRINITRGISLDNFKKVIGE